MLRWRLILGVAFVAALALLFWLDLSRPGWFLFPLALLLAGLATQEMLRLTRVSLVTDASPAAATPTIPPGPTARPLSWTAYAGALLVVASNGPPLLIEHCPVTAAIGPLGWPLAALAVAVLLAFVGEFARYETPQGVTINLALTLLTVVYVGLLSFPVQLRVTPDADWGAVALISLLVTVKMCDIGAYTVGRLIGRHKLARLLSPGKTIEGLFGGLLFAIGGAWFSLNVLAPRMIGFSPAENPTPWWGVVCFGLLVGGAGVIGDLAESLMKRSAGVKDSSDWMPGFGGVLDLLDSVLLAAPAAYACWALGVVGPGR